MKRRRFLNVVPKAVQFWALVIVGCAPLIGLAAGYARGATLHRLFVDGSLGVLAGIVIATWLLSLGYVFADARQRAMPAIPWTLMALLVPNLLGFLLYFVMRRPLTAHCTSCGQAISSDHPFCSWCGSSQSRPQSSDTPPSQPGSSVLNAGTTV